MKEARYFRREAANKVFCMLCPHGCHIADGKNGLCRGRGIVMEFFIVPSRWLKPWTLVQDFQLLLSF